MNTFCYDRRLILHFDVPFFLQFLPLFLHSFLYSLWCFFPFHPSILHHKITSFLRVLVATNPQRSSAGPTQRARCKLSVIADASAELSLSLPAEKLFPYEDHFHPILPKLTNTKRTTKIEARKMGHPMVGVNVLPHEEQAIRNEMLEKWDYCLRRLYVLKGQTVKAAIGYVKRCSSRSYAKVKVLTRDSLFSLVGRWHRVLKFSSSRSQTQVSHLKSASTLKSKSGG